MMAENPDGNLQDDDLWTLFCSIAVVLIIWVVLFDTAAHRITHGLHHEVHEHKHVVISEYRDKLYYLLWSSLQSELMVLGFLAFTIWLCNEVHLFDFISQLLEKESSHQSHDARPSKVSRIWHVPCTRIVPQEADELLELVEHAHMVLFISMVLYFVFLAIVLSRLLRTFHQYEVQEFKASHGQVSTRASEQRILKHVDCSRTYLLRRVQIMFEDELADRPEVKAVVAQGILDYTAFLEVTTRELIERLVEFPLSTWFLVGMYFGLLAIGGNLLCFSMEFSFSILVDGFYALSTLYMAVRLTVFRRRVASDTTNVSAWPCHVLDRATSLIIGPGITGFYPWSNEPSEVTALSCTQAMLFFQVVWLAYMMVPNPVTHRVVKMTHLPGGVWVQLFVRLLCLSLWALFILPEQLEVFALPPFITDEEVEGLFTVLSMHPTGNSQEPDADPHRSHSVGLMMRRRATRLRRTIVRGSTADRLLAGHLDES